MTPGEGMVGWGDNMQIVGPLGNATEDYFYYHKSNCPDGKTVTTEFYWGDAELNPVIVSFDAGSSVGIDNPNAYEYSIQTSGQVPTEEASFAAHENLNWTGNPFPAAISINAINLDDGMTPGEGMVGWGDNMQIVGPLGNATDDYFYYHKSNCPEGKTVTTEFYWGDAELNPVEVTLQPGDSVAIDNPNGYDYTIRISPPYSL